MKTQTPPHRSVRFFFGIQICALMIFVLALGCWPTVTRAEQPKARGAARTGHDGKPTPKALPPETQEDEGADPPLPGSGLYSAATIISAPFGTSFQVNISNGQNILGDAANEASMCMDPSNPNLIAIAWRQFNSTNSDFRQAGYAFSSDGGRVWTFGGTLQTNVFRSDPVLATDAEGRFYYLSLNNANTFTCDIWRSTNGGAIWRLVGAAQGGDKSWMTIDTTPSPGHGTIYQSWQRVSPTGTRDFTFSADGGVTWTNPFAIPQAPYFGTVDVGPNGEVYHFAQDGTRFWLNRSTNAPNHAVPFAFDLTVPVDLGGSLLFGGGPNGVGLLGQAWVAVDRSTNATRGNVYALCSTGSPTNQCDVMFARSTNRGATWSAPVRINTDPGTNAFHWFGAIAVAPNGRVDVCWYDTRGSTNINVSQLFYSYSLDGGVTWSPNRAVSGQFDTSLGYPQQNKIGDYITVIALNDATCVAYSATFNGEEDIYFLRMPDLPIQVTITKAGANANLSWNSIPGNTYCLQYKSSITAPWPVGSNQICFVATNFQSTISDALIAGIDQRYYRVAVSGFSGDNSTILSQPVSVTNYVSLAATFTINAYSTSPLSYQWKKNGVAIPGATQRSLTLQPLAFGDAGTYMITISNANGSLDSSPATLTVLSPPATAPDISGLVLHLPFDTNLTDATGRGNNGTAIHLTSGSSNVSSATFVSGMLGAALHYASDFGASPCCTTTNTSYVTLGVRPDLQFGSSVNFSVAYWVRLPVGYAGGDLPIFCDAVNSTFLPGFTFAPSYGSQGTQGSGSVTGAWAASVMDLAGNGFGAYGDAGSINDGAWHHLVHTFDRANGAAITYLDGVAAHYVSQAGSIATAGNIDTGQPANIGQDPTGQYSETGSGDIDDLGVWRRSLTALEAASIYMAGVSNHLSFTGSP
jgi:hypothetical protein